MVSLSIIIVSYNTRGVTLNCLSKLENDLKKYPLDSEVIVVDNGSTDGSREMLTDTASEWKILKPVFSDKNLGFGKGNNLGLKSARGRYILFLNSDTIIENIDFRDLINIFEMRKDAGALTVKVNLPAGGIDPASHRGFPTIWRSFCYFSGLEKAMAGIPILNKVFGGYHLLNLNLNEVHEIEVPTGAFLMTRKEIVDKIGGFDEEYFAYGEDIEMAFQIKKLGYKIFYYPLWEVIHIKSASGLKKKNDEIRKKISHYFYDSMKIFYRKHYEKNHFWLINKLVYRAIDFKAGYKDEKNRH